jgi:hypothetical protein
MRIFLLQATLAFVRSAQHVEGVHRIALVGSLTTHKPIPKDADVLVTIDDAVDLKQLAQIGRSLKGTTQTRNFGADIFLADQSGRYLGRICNWRECEPGRRQACRALHCGSRRYLSDDLQVITLPQALILDPPVRLWPVIEIRAQPPKDVVEHLLQPLAGDASSRSPGS